jgi:hypothetical protein
MKVLRVIFFILILISTKLVFGQSLMEHFTVNPKLGIYISAKSGGFGGGLEMHTKYKGVMYSVDYFYLDEFVILGDHPSENYSQFGFMAGNYFDESIFRFQFQGGLALTGGTRRTSLLRKEWLGDIYNSEKFITPGLVGKFGLKIIPVSYFAIGIDLQANVNTKNSLFMPMLSLEFGKLK